RQVLHLRAQAGHAPDLAASRTLRQTLAQVLREAIGERRDLLGLFVAFDRDALDGHDAAFVDQPALGSNDSGRFTLYWLQPQPGQLQAVPG
ncbi:hypothetical protein NL393_33480, partial [Klebsiella pneumoniae]|nr:hypothetical protein [Klebsiella pneumoniae]